VTAEQVQQATGFELQIDADLPETPRRPPSNWHCWRAWTPTTCAPARWEPEHEPRSGRRFVAREDKSVYETAEPVLYEVRDGIATVTMNRPGFNNAQNSQMTYALDAGFRRAVDDDAVKVIVLRGAGKHFSAGHDIGTPGRDIDKPFDRQHLWWDHTNKPGGEQYFVREQEVYLGMCRRWHDIPKPTIAMVQGACIAGGLMLAWVCDLIVASDDAFFQDPVVRMGIPGVEYFAHAHELNPRIAKEFLYLGERMGAERAWQMGMVNKVVPRAELEAALRLGRQARAAAAHGAGADQDRDQPRRRPAGPAHDDGRGLRLPPLRPHAQPVARRRHAGRAGREVHGGRQQEAGMRRRSLEPCHLRTPLCDLLGCRYPVVQTAMGWVAGPSLVAATTNAGGFGFLAGATIAADRIEADILRVKRSPATSRSA
jgi:enoyl-CoA hydratase